MSYAVKEIFKTLQGEGAQMGRAAVFCRFSGCNLWSGREADRATSVCTFCDTDFVGIDGTGGGRFADADALADAIAAEWNGSAANRYVVLTGGEPLLQVDDALVAALHARDFEIGVETNGTQAAPAGLDWICVSPKANAELLLQSGHELKLVYPQETALPERFAHLAFDHFFLQPMDSPTAAANLEAAISYCTDNPRWRLSLQSHKMIGIR
ncbi:7-carboxy-7-deazaguanine synthase [Sphingomonas sp. Leaf24]|uniref:7-carboxy-7-deazaguanine synthase n=1 Tax=unclassified Sphingomonas TaxID=196159 RepID=UPI0006F62CC9|nr:MULTISPECIES: 7-carboxy-7-deazaguanine synthase [unclassified Sphingomonas]KQM17206.1 7-carboxy-7-deazaguanine synthase [Sphingomonas sp. Leaf5]KQM88098.1 7-carboxy-7-deazaguanine synthase [Sphingomonas sp. Leaf24]